MKHLNLLGLVRRANDVTDEKKLTIYLRDNKLSARQSAAADKNRLTKYFRNNLTAAAAASQQQLAADTYVHSRCKQKAKNVLELQVIILTCRHSIASIHRQEVLLQ